MGRGAQQPQDAVLQCQMVVVHERRLGLGVLVVGVGGYPVAAVVGEELQPLLDLPGVQQVGLEVRATTASPQLSARSWWGREFWHLLPQETTLRQKGGPHLNSSPTSSAGNDLTTEGRAAPEFEPYFFRKKRQKGRAPRCQQLTC